MKGILRHFLRKVLVISVGFLFIQNSFASNTFVDLFEQNKHFIDELDYYKSKEVAINLFGKQLSLNWGDIGHGDILKPFKGIKPEVTDIEVVSNDLDSDNEDNFGAVSVGKRIAKVFLKQQIKKFVGQNLDDFLEKLPLPVRWITEKIVKNGKLSPVEEFVLRSYILYKTPFDNDKQALKTAEFTALLFKLALTEGQDILDVENGLGSYLVNSETINELLGQDFVEFAVDILLSLQNGFQDCDFDNFDTIDEQIVVADSYNYKVAYVFRSLDLAEQCLTLFDNKEYSEKEFKKIVGDFIHNLTVDDQDIFAPKNYETISVANFEKYEKSTFSNFVGFEDDADKIAEIIPVAELVEEEQDNYLNVQLIQDDNEYWVVLKIQDKESNSDLSKTLKFTIAAIYKTFKDYKVIKNSGVVDTTGGSDSLKLENEEELAESKQELENLLNAKRYLKQELVSLDLEIEKMDAKLDSSNNNLWNKFFTGMNEEKLQDLLEKRKRKEIELLNLETEIQKLTTGLYYLTAPERLQNLADKGVFAITADMLLSNPKVC